MASFIFGIAYLFLSGMVMPMDNANDIIERLGGATKAARKLGLSITTVHSWGRRGSIPAWRVEAVQRALADQEKVA